jgi:hypothetical protein
MGLIKTQKTFINEDRYVYPDPEIIIQTTRNPNNVNLLGSGDANNDNGYIYFYANSLWKTQPFVYVGESKNNLQTRHNSTHKNSDWFKVLNYPFIGIVNSPNKPWDTDTRRAIESLTIHKLHTIGLQIINHTNSTWVNGGTVHPNVNHTYVDHIANIIVNYITHNIGYDDKYDANSSENMGVWGKVGAKTSTKYTPVEETRKSGEPKEIKEVAGAKGETKPNDSIGDRGKNVKGRTFYAQSLKELIDTGTLQPNTQIFSTEPKYPAEATILENGTILFNGNIYATGSAAGRAARMLIRPEATQPNGWDFWATKNPDGSLKRLSQWREEHIKSLD